MLASAIKTTLNNFIKEFGKIEHMKLDTQTKSIEATLFLIGEREPLEVTISNYTLVQKDDGYYLQLQRIKTSKEWITKAAATYLTKRALLKIPDKFVAIIKKVL